MSEAVIYIIVTLALLSIALMLVMTLLPGLLTINEVKVVFTLVEDVGSHRFLLVKLHSTFPIAQIHVNSEEYVPIIYPGGRECVVIVYSNENSKFCYNNTCVIQVCDRSGIVCKEVVITAK